MVARRENAVGFAETRIHTPQKPVNRRDVAAVAGTFFLVAELLGVHFVAQIVVSVSVFGAVFGFVGLLVAVPMAAMIGVVIRFALAQYKEGRLYRGLSGTE